MNHDEGYTVAFPPDACNDTDAAAEEAAFDYLRSGIPPESQFLAFSPGTVEEELTNRPPPTRQHSACEQQQEKRTALEGEERRDETYTDTDDDAETIQGNHLIPGIPPKSKFLAA